MSDNSKMLNFFNEILLLMQSDNLLLCILSDT